MRRLHESTDLERLPEGEWRHGNAFDNLIINRVCIICDFKIFVQS